MFKFRIESISYFYTLKHIMFNGPTSESYSFSIQFSSVTQLYPTLCDPMDCSMPGFLIHHQLPELVQITDFLLDCSVQFSCSVMSDSLQPHGLQHGQVSLSITNFQSLLKLMSIESVMLSNHLIFCRPLLLPPSVFPSIRVFSDESVLHIRWPKDWSFSFSIGLSNEYSGLIFFRMDWLDLLAVQGTLKSLLQHHSSKVSVCQCSTSFIVQLSHPYLTTGKTIALTRWIFVGKVQLYNH